MSELDPDLAQFVEVVTALAGRHLAPGQPLAGPQAAVELEKALAEADVLDLALETAELDDARTWLAQVVRAVARSSPSVALALAARYAAHRALAAPGAAMAGFVAGLDLGAGAHATVPALFGVDVAVLLAPDGSGGVVATSPADETGPARTGLRDADLRTVRVGAGADTVSDARAAALDLSLFIAAASLGTAEASVRLSAEYAVDRRQFGSNLLSFAGMRAMLAEMALRVDTVTALLDAALRDGTAAGCAELSATAGRVAVDVALDAIQVHGGYGYIDEYPVAGLLRDALSLRARAAARRSSVARVASERFGPVG